MALVDNQDQETERLIAQMLMEDLSFLEDQAAAESLQVAQVMATSQAASGGADSDEEVVSIPVPHASDVSSTSADFAAAFRTMTNDALSAADVSLVLSMSKGSEGAMIRDYQAALKIAAEERRSNLDYAFARRLQAVDDAGETDADGMTDADQVLGREMVEGILADDLNSKGKGRDTGKLKAKDNGSFSQIAFVAPSPLPKPTSGILKCGICHEAFLQTKNPFKASQTPNSSSRVSFGQVFPCPGAHGYCIDCTTSYIRSKLEDGGSDRIVFPIRCPECSPLAWQMDDETAASVLSPDLLDVWHHQKLLESLPKFWCPSARCSELIATDDELEGVQAACPSCQTQICVACRSTWHDNMTCEEYQELPEDERMPEDLAVLELARAERWRRCPSCHVLVELTQGCNHITCTCRFEFCFRCGSDWKDRCTRDPPCELWQEDMLLEERERARLRVGLAPAARPVAVVPPAAVVQPRLLYDYAIPAYQPPQYRAPEPVRFHNQYDNAMELDWIGDPAETKYGHAFTGVMVRGLTCGYCNARLNSLGDLRYHLANTNRHPVYACCGKFFKRDVHFDQHQRSGTCNRDNTIERGRDADF